VLDLKHAIQVKYKIAAQHQVLVVNGGECMAAERRVCSYSAGTVSGSSFCKVILSFECHTFCNKADGSICLYLETKIAKVASVKKFEFIVFIA